MGVHRDELAHNVSIDLDADPNPKIRLGFDDFVKLLSFTEAHLKDPHTGLHIGERFRIPTVGEHTNILSFAKDIEEAAHVNSRYTCLLHSLGVPLLVKEPENEAQSAKFSWMPNFPKSKDVQYRQISEYVITNYVMTLNWLAWGFGKGVAKVNFRHAAQAHIAEYVKVLGCPVEFSTEENAVILKDGILNRPLPTANHENLSLMRSKLERILASYNSKNNLRAVVEQKIREIIGVQKPTLPLIASKLEFNARSLRRNLNEQNTSFATILKSVKMDLCLSYMNDGRPISEIAYLLWYSDQSAFSRAFKKWYGVTPKQYRL